MIWSCYCLCVRDCDQEVNVTTHFVCARINEKSQQNVNDTAHIMCSVRGLAFFLLQKWEKTLMTKDSDRVLKGQES